MSWPMCAYWESSRENSGENEYKARRLIRVRDGNTKTSRPITNGSSPTGDHHRTLCGALDHHCEKGTCGGSHTTAQRWVCPPFTLLSINTCSLVSDLKK